MGPVPIGILSFLSVTRVLWITKPIPREKMKRTGKKNSLIASALVGLNKHITDDAGGCRKGPTTRQVYRLETNWGITQNRNITLAVPPFSELTL